MKTLFLTLASTLAMLAADITGEWKGTAEGPNGAMERTFTFKVDGAKLTGETVSSFVGKSVIEDGKVSGDSVTFTITAKFQDNEMKLTYKGKVTGADTMVLASERQGGEGPAIEWKAKKVK